MKILSSDLRKVETERGAIVYTLERKEIKNINLRIRHDGKIFVSAPKRAQAQIIDCFVISKMNFITKALDKFIKNKNEKLEMQYISGENITLLGKNMRISVVKDKSEYVSCDGVYVYIHVKRPDYYNRKKNLLNNWINTQCSIVFNDVIQEVHTRFVSYDIVMPQLVIRNMSSRWGSCLPNKGIITLNKRLIESPKNCIEYVVYHEFCHFIHPNHSKEFYMLLQVMLPDWKRSKQILEDSNIV